MSIVIGGSKLLKAPVGLLALAENRQAIAQSHPLLLLNFACSI